MLIALANQSTRIAIAASPAPRKIALMRKSSMIVALPPSITRAKVEPLASTDGDAPISASRRGARAAPATPRPAATMTPSTIACTAARAAPSRSCSPVRRATTAVAPMERPTAMA